MSSHTPRALLILVLLCAVVLSACGPATPSESGSAGPATGPAITVLERAYTLDELRALEQVTTTVDDRTATGVSLLALLTDAAESLPETVVLVASDGYSANVDTAEVDAAGVLGITDENKLDALIPTVAKAAWVRDVIEIRSLEPAAPSADAPQGIDPIALDEPLVLTDAAGRTVTLEALPGRLAVVGTGPHMSLHILYMFDEGRERLIATESRASTASEFLPMVDPVFESVPTLAAHPNVEQIASMSPDLVIMKGITEDATAVGLAEAGIPVLYVDLETMDAFFQDLANIGAVLGNPERAEEIAAFYRSRLEGIDAALAEISERPDVLLLSYSVRGTEVAVKVPAAAWMQTAEIERAGGNPVWLEAAAPTDGWTVTNFEQIARWDPEMIFVVIDHTLDMQGVIDSLKADANWAALKAVQSDALYAFPQDIFGWDQPEPRWILGVQWLATRLHPDYVELDMDAEVRSWFSELYGMDEAAFEANILPRLEMDVR